MQGYLNLAGTDLDHIYEGYGLIKVDEETYNGLYDSGLFYQTENEADGDNPAFKMLSPIE